MTQGNTCTAQQVQRGRSTACRQRCTACSRWWQQSRVCGAQVHWKKPCLLESRVPHFPVQLPLSPGVSGTPQPSSGLGERVCSACCPLCD